MKSYLKIFLLAFLGFAVLIGGGLFLLTRDWGAVDDGSAKEKENPIAALFSGAPKYTEEDRLSLERMVKKSRRMNVLLMGLNSGLSDTMMLFSYDPDTKLVDVISVPRDTYNVVPGHTSGGAKKLNAVHNFKGEDGGPEGTAREVSKILGIPVDYYVTVDYKAVREVVDILGGIEVDIPFRMKYDDPYDKPPLHIDFQPGKKVLDGEEAVKFLRWRHNNKGVAGGGNGGDLQRIERQQEFVKTAIKKAMGLKLPLIIPTAFKYVKTDMSLGDMVKLGTGMADMDASKIRSYRIPGDARMIDGLSYFVHYPKETEAVMLAIYNRTGEEVAAEGTLTKLEDVDPSMEKPKEERPVVESKPEQKPKATEEGEAAEETSESPADEDLGTGADTNLTDEAVPDDFNSDGTLQDIDSPLPPAEPAEEVTEPVATEPEAPPADLAQPQ